MKNVIINDLLITYKEHGAPSGDTIIFLHGNSQSHHAFSKINFEELSHLRLIFVDLPGHGFSASSDFYSLPFFANIISDFIKELKLEHYLLVGHSLGAHIITQALRHTAPAAIMLFGMPPLRKPFDVNAFLPNPNAAALSLENPSEKEIENLLSEFKVEEETKKQLALDYKNTDRKFRSLLMASVAAGLYEDEIVELANYGGKILLVNCLKDPFINSDYINKNFESLNSPSKQIIHQNVGHSLHTEAPRLFIDLLNHFQSDVFNQKQHVTENYITTQPVIENSRSLEEAH